MEKTYKVINAKTGELMKKGNLQEILDFTFLSKKAFKHTLNHKVLMYGKYYIRKE